MSKALTTRSIDTKVETFVKLKEKRQQLADAKKQLDEQYNQIRDELREVMKDKKVLTLKTEDYTLTRSNRQTMTIVDHQKLIKAYKKWGIPAPLKVDYWVAQTQLRDRLKANRRVPGVEMREQEYVSVRLNKKGGEK